jgi:hypothetical protein
MFLPHFHPPSLSFYTLCASCPVLPLYSFLDQAPRDWTSPSGYAPWSKPGGIANSLGHHSLHQDEKWRTSLRYNMAMIRREQEILQTPPDYLEALPEGKLDGP